MATSGIVDFSVGQTAAATVAAAIGLSYACICLALAAPILCVTDTYFMGLYIDRLFYYWHEIKILLLCNSTFVKSLAPIYKC